MFEIAASTKKVWDRDGDRSERTVYQVASVSVCGVLLHHHQFVDDLAGAERLLARVRKVQSINRIHWYKSDQPLELTWPIADRMEFLEHFDGEPNWITSTQEELDSYYAEGG